ncbi:SDR family oxidoreductase [Spirulina sp. CS-785/01]|uniref:SDR family oxidoreductase n=1 Tax=Spirulina sp. CS-785/01 TaxID=3021716 RepID=UPI00232BA61A|nr:SDR family oxidoreductase [Spirulina sp. CS-785/01]MDB9314042.1 SDR family oxidoreductase [Spirulina sp. CS-785/01]
MAENLLQAAQTRGLPVSIYRPGNIIGHSETGISQTSDFVAKMLQGCLEMSIAPDLPVKLNVVPVNQVSQAIVALSEANPPRGAAYHLVHPTPMPWSDLITVLQKRGYAIQLTSYEHWYAHLLKLTRRSPHGETHQNALLSLVSMLKNPTLVQLLLGSFSWQVHQTSQALAVLGLGEFPDCPQFLNTYLDYLTQIKFLPTPVPHGTTTKVCV